MVRHIAVEARVNPGRYRDMLDGLDLPWVRLASAGELESWRASITATTSGAEPAG